MRLNSVLVISSGTIYRYYRNKSLLVDINQKKDYILKDISNLIWREIDGKKTIKDLINMFSKDKFKEKEIIQIIKKLEKLNLIELIETPNSNKKKNLQGANNSNKKPKYHLMSIFTKWAETNKVPLSATFELTYKCNFKCVHCYIKKGRANKNKELSFDEIKYVLDDLAELGTPVIGFTGGEIFLRKDIINILEYASKKGFAIILQTNGSLINKTIVNKLKNLKIILLDISIYGTNKYTYKKITNNKNAFQQIMTSLKLLSKTNLPISFSVVPLKENYKDIKKIIKLAKQLGYAYSLAENILPTDEGNLEPLKHWCSYEQYLKIAIKRTQFKNFVKYILNRKVKFNLKKRMCGAGWNITIDPFGYVKPCITWYGHTANVRKNPIKKIYRYSKILKRARTISIKDLPCRKCNLINVCFLCPSQALKCEEWRRKLNMQKIQTLQKLYKNFFRKDFKIQNLEQPQIIK
jgi:radical SAM protein with 4Fe4S-binding SPASM domain